MDYLLCSSLQGVGLKMVCSSYDVACSYFLNFFRRMPLLPRALHIPSSLLRQFHTMVPKFHLQAHAEKCQSNFNFNFCPGVGRTEGEGPERNWDELNGQAPSTAEMGPGHRWETLDDCCGWANWRKTTGLGKYSKLLQTYLLTGTYRKPPPSPPPCRYPRGVSDTTRPYSLHGLSRGTGPRRAGADES